MKKLFLGTSVLLLSIGLAGCGEKEEVFEYTNKDFIKESREIEDKSSDRYISCEEENSEMSEERSMCLSNAYEESLSDFKKLEKKADLKEQKKYVEVRIKSLEHGIESEDNNVKYYMTGEYEYLSESVLYSEKSIRSRKNSEYYFLAVQNLELK